jgi:two-component system chemotaxis response regulator CheY
LLAGLVQHFDVEAFFCQIAPAALSSSRLGPGLKPYAKAENRKIPLTLARDGQRSCAALSAALAWSDAVARGWKDTVIMKRCLIVDDSRVVRKVARRIVEDLRFEADEAADGAQALDTCRKAMPDCILLDWNMPVMNGIDFLRALRREPGGDRPTVVFCTTENDMSHIAEAMRSGANEYIMKPFDSEIIESKFSEVGLV